MLNYVAKINDSIFLNFKVFCTIVYYRKLLKLETHKLVFLNFTKPHYFINIVSTHYCMVVQDAQKTKLDITIYYFSDCRYKNTLRNVRTNVICIL